MLRDPFEQTQETQMNQSREVPQRRAFAIRRRLEEATGQSGRTILLGTVLILTAVSAAVGYALAQFYSVDIVTSLLHPPEDCFGRWGTNIGRHCFSDYAMVVDAGTRVNPWDDLMFPGHQPGGMVYPAAGMIPHLLFGIPAKWLGAPLLGLFGYQLALTIAVLSPAVWAARGAQGLERVVVFVALGAAAIPAWAVIDRGNSVGFMVPIALVFLVALRQQRWGLAVIMVILAALVKPQFVVLAVALFAARKWRMGGFAICGAVISNLAAYLLWPHQFPHTIMQSIHNLFANNYPFQWLLASHNVSFGKTFLLIPDFAELLTTGGKIPDGFLAGPRVLIGYIVLVLVVGAVTVLGRRIPPVIAGIVLLPTAALFPALAMSYYLVFALPIAALVVRDPGGLPGVGIFDQLGAHGVRRRAVGIWVSLAAAVTIAQIAVPVPIMRAEIPYHAGSRAVVNSTTFLAPILWLVACAVIIISYARSPTPRGDGDQAPARDGAPDAGLGNTSPTSELAAES
ncbi:hypothetical protein CKJ61_15385 [Mycobacterium intracellulare]|nr:hypothetical protein CKJ61_15385 [Mycobacterium intracellulare]